MHKETSEEKTERKQRNTQISKKYRNTETTSKKETNK